MTDAERAARARKFLRSLLEGESRLPEDAVYFALQLRDPERVSEKACAALGRLLVAWAVGEIEGVMSDLDVDEVTIRRDKDA